MPVLQKDDYDTWAMEMEHYLEYIDNEVWKVIQNGNSKKRVTKGKDGVYRVLPPTTQEEQVADEKERKARTLLLMAFQKIILKLFMAWMMPKRSGQPSRQGLVESLEKGYDRFQKLLSQLDALGAGVSDEDANHKFLRSLPPAWDSLAMTMRTKRKADTLSIDDLYNNLSVFEQDIQKTSSSSLTSDNVAFLSQAKASSSKHKPSHSSGSYSSYTTSSSKAKPTATPGLADEVIHSFLATNADDVDLIHDDLYQIVDLDLEEMANQLADCMTAIKINKFYKKTDQLGRADEDEETQSCLLASLKNMSHLIKDCDYYEKKIAREAALKSKRVIHVDARQARPAWTNTNRVNKANQFTPRPVQLSNISPNFSTASRTIKTGRVNVNTGKQNVSSGSKHVNSGRMYVNSGTQNKSGVHEIIKNSPKRICYFGGSKEVTVVKKQLVLLAIPSQTGKVSEALEDGSWVEAMQEELLQFKLQQVWLGSSKVIDKKKGLTMMSFCTFSKMKLSGYMVVKALYGLHQSLELVMLLCHNPEKQWIQEGTIDKTLFIRRNKKDIMLVQVYVDDIIFGSTNKSWCDEFEALMQSDISNEFHGNSKDFSSHLSRGSSSTNQGKTKLGIRSAFCTVLEKMGHLKLVQQLIPKGQEHAAQAQTQPIPPPPPIPSTTPTPIPTSTPPPPPIPSPTPPPIPTPTSPPPPPPETEPPTDEHTYEEQSPVHHHFSPSQAQAPSHMPTDDLLQTVPKLISRIDSLELDLKQTKLTMGNAIVKLVKKVKKLEGFLKRRNLVLTDSEDEEPEVQGRKSQADPQDSSKQGLVTPPTTKAHASGEEQEEEISPNTLEAAKTLSKVASLKSRSIDKGRRYKRRKESTSKKVVSSLDFQEDNTGAEKINTAGEVNAASIEVNTASKVNTGSIELNTVIEQDSTAGENKGQREGKAPMLSEETPKKTKEQILQEEASLAEAIRLDFP
ncbi:hypothetical protein Tco_1493602 [Tanacetum coccineum]